MNKIALLNYDLKNGGAQRASANIGNHFIQEGYKVDMILFDTTNPTYTFNGNIQSLPKRDESTLSKNSMIRKFQIIYDYYNIYRNLKEIKKKNKYDAVISFLLFPNLMNALTRKQEGIVIVSVRAYIYNTIPTFFRTKIYPMLRKIAYKKADYVVAVSKDIEDQLIKEYQIDAKKIKVIYNGYPLKEIRKYILNNNNKKSTNNKIKIVTAGRLSNQKGHIHLIRIINEISKTKKYDFELLIFGEGPLRNELLNLIDLLKLGQYVRIMGYTTNIYSELAKADIFVFSSHFEGFPNALMEAMALGLPILTTDCPTGPREIVGNSVTLKPYFYEFGLMVPKLELALDDLSHSETIFMNLLLNLMNDSDLRFHYSRKSIERSNDFEMSKVINNWKKIIEKKNKEV